MVIQQQEILRITKMIESDDIEMRMLASEILQKKMKIRYSFTTIVAFNIFLYVLTMVGVVCWLHNYTHWYDWVACILCLCLHIIVSTHWLLGVAEFRKVYNKEVNIIFE